MPPLGLAMLAAYLERRGFVADIVDCYADPAADRGIREYLVDRRPALLGFSCTTSSFLDGARLAAAAKELLPGVTTVFGGPHVSAMRERVLRDYPAVDLVVVGEGEETLSDLMDGGAAAPAGVPGDRLPRRRGRGGLHGTPEDQPRAGLPAAAGLRQAQGVPRRLQPADLQLPAHAEHQLHQQPRLPVRLLLLRPLGLRAQLPLQLGRVPPRPPAPPARALRHPPHQLLRRPVHLPPGARREVLPADARKAARHDVQLRRARRARRPARCSR